MKLCSPLPVLVLTILCGGLIQGATAEPLIAFEYTAPEIDAAEPLPITKSEGGGFYGPSHGGQPWTFYSWSDNGKGMALWQAPQAGGIGVGISPFLDGSTSDPMNAVQGMLTAPISLSTATHYFLKISYTSEGDGVPGFTLKVGDNQVEIGADCVLDTVTASESRDSITLQAPSSTGEWKEAVIPFSVESATGELTFIFSVLSSNNDGAVYIRSVKLEVDERH
jgi:hypothetical protein